MSITIWLSGKSRSGKTTIGNLLFQELQSSEKEKICFLDDEELQNNLCIDLGLSPEERHIAALRVAYVAKLLNEYRVSCIIATVVPYRSTYEKLRNYLNKGYIEIYLDCPLNQIINRIANEEEFNKKIKFYYEEPVRPELRLDTYRQSPVESISQIIFFLKTLGLFTTNYDKSIKEDFSYTKNERDFIEQRLKDLGYI